MSTLFNILHQNSHSMVILVPKNSPLINVPFWKISRPRESITNNMVHIFHLQLVHLDFISTFCEVLPQNYHWFTFNQLHIFQELCFNIQPISGK